VARIAGVDLPKDKRIEIALQYIFGIGPTSATQILEKTGVNPNTRVHALSDNDVTKLRRAIESEYTVEGSLRSEIAMNIKRLVDIGSYRGLRHRRGLPVRGQRTKTNARTRKGPRRSIGGLKKKPVGKK
jgi:small subunit ribosomal protein S13